MPHVDITEFGSDTRALEEAIAFIGTAHDALLIPIQVDVTKGVLVKENVPLHFVKGGRLHIEDGCTVTIKSEIRLGRPSRMGMWQIFDGPGLVSFEGNQDVEAVYPQWWGAIGDGVHDDTSAMQRAINTEKRAVMSAGDFLITDKLMAHSGQKLNISGESRDRSRLVMKCHKPMFVLDSPGSTAFENLTLLNSVTYDQLRKVGDPARECGLICAGVNGASKVLLTECVLDGAYNGIRPNRKSSAWTVSKCEFRNQKMVGVMSDAHDLTVERCHFHDIGEDIDDDTFYKDGHGHHTHAVYIDALVGETTSHITISNNSFFDCTGSAVIVQTGHSYATIENVIIENNLFARNGSFRHFDHTTTRFRDDIYLGTTSGAEYGSVVKNVTIRDNLFAEPTPTHNDGKTKDWDFKIAIRAINNCRDVLIERNTAVDYNLFVDLDASRKIAQEDAANCMANIKIANNVANLNRGNICDIQVASGVYYIGRTGTSIEITSNLVRNSAGNGITLYGSNQGAVTVSDNVLSGCGPGGNQGCAGILLKPSKDNEPGMHNVEIERNIMVDGSSAAKTGIRLNKGCNGNVIKNNLIIGTRDSSIWLSDGTKDNNVTGNTCAGGGCRIRHNPEDNNKVENNFTIADGG